MSGLSQEFDRAQYMIDVKRYGEAVNLLASAVAADPGDSRGWCLLARAHAGQGQYAEAASAAGQAVALAPLDDWPHRLVSNAYMHLGDTVVAVRAAAEACRLAPNEWRAQLCLAQAALASRGQLGLAERAAVTARSIAPDEPDVHFVSGQVSLARGNRKDAVAHHERALALNPDHPGALNELGRIRLSRAHTALAARHFLQAARSAPGVSGYSQNIEVVVRRTVALVIYIASVASVILTYLAITNNLPRVAVLSGLAAVAVFTAGFGVVQFRRMPRETRPLFRRRRIAQALGISYGSILLALVVAAVSPAKELADALMIVTVLIIASRFAAYGLLRREATESRRGA
ncbi:MAG TPA: tetratricopeptide repeat protein [Streptosporangiaceae bacterium]|jgi:tetratricopeptide (TPR) repeat protein